MNNIEARADLLRPHAERLLPAWFVWRMLDDCWHFAFLMRTGDTIHIETIEAVQQAADGTVWIDVCLHCRPYLLAEQGAVGARQVVAPTSRTRASINAAHIVMAFETADT